MRGEAYGSRVLGATGDNSYLGGKLDWNNVNKNAQATLELNKQIGGRTNVSIIFVILRTSYCSLRCQMPCLEEFVCLIWRFM